MAKLTIHIEGCRNDSGHVMCALYADPADFPEPRSDDKVIAATAAVHSGQATALFPELTPGRYALAVIHDENDNQRMDTNFLGMPKEGFVFGNDATRMGKPRFNECAVDVADDESVRLRMHYMTRRGLR